ncbi:MAG TPA: hypothetical protein VKG82_01280 [Solirubrobacteraceae bacterium]|nr:hypothetical protein [Solirubrobacteraceae bacterium]
MSSESIASPTPYVGAPAHCAACGAALAPDQRYCLECGERCVPMSSVLMGAALAAGANGAGATTPSSPPTQSAGTTSGQAQGSRNTTLTVIAGVGVLLLAMGVGVLIGRSGGSKPSAAPPQVISVAGAGTAPASGGTGEAAFTSDWPVGTKGYTVQLQTLPASTSASAVQAAKSAATAKGASAVGALKAEEFSSLTSSGYVIYSGADHTRAEATKALGSLKKSFPGASVVEVSNKASSSASGSGSGGSSSSSGGGGGTLSHPAPPSALEPPKKSTGKSYEETSKNLPNVVETG